MEEILDEYNIDLIKEAIEEWKSSETIPEDIFKYSDLKMSRFIGALIDYQRLGYITPESCLRMLKKFHEEKENWI